MKKPIYLLLSLLAAASVQVRAQTPAPAGANLIHNGDFKLPGKSIDNLWDGVEPGGYLNGNVETGVSNIAAPLLRLSGGVGNTPAPISVSAVDLNHDGLPDLQVATSSGYVLCYFNSGTPTEPKFTNAEVLPVYLASGYMYDGNRDGNREVLRPDVDRTAIWRRLPRINFFDWSHSGKFDLLAGNYRGELLFFPSKGGGKDPDYRQVMLDSAQVLHTKNHWGNLFAPVAFDFDNDGRVDVAFGEASYSANAIHLFLNKGTNGNPKFDETAHHYLAYGDGNEQLVPTLADANGDGLIDLIVGDREGKVGVYLNPGKEWKPGTDFKLNGYLDFGGSKQLGYPAVAYAADMNGDGLFDLVFGKPNGRIALAINKGTKEQPKFGLPVDLKGADLFSQKVVTPPGGPVANPSNPTWHYASGWTVDYALTRGNPYAYFSVIGNKDDSAAEIPADRFALKAGYFPSPNKVFKSRMPIFPGVDEKEFGTNSRLFWGHVNDARGAWVFASDQFTARCILMENSLKLNKRYRLTFNSKGSNFKGEWRLGYSGCNKPEQKQIRGDRGAVQTINIDLKHEEVLEEGTFPANPKWTETSKTISLNFKDPALRNPDVLDRVWAVLEIRAQLKPSDGVMYIENVQLVETK